MERLTYQIYRAQTRESSFRLICCVPKWIVVSQAISVVWGAGGETLK